MESALPDGSPANADSFGPDISDDGRFLAFHSSGQLIPGSGDDPTQQIVLRDRQLDTTIVLSMNEAGERGNDNSSGAVISGDGRVVAFQSYATNLVPGADGNGAASDVYAVTVATRAIVRVSTTSTGRQHANGASFGPSISGDGQLIAFTSSAWLDEEQQRPARRTRKALPLPPNGELRNVFVRDLARGTTQRISRTSRGDAKRSELPPGDKRGRSLGCVRLQRDRFRGRRRQRRLRRVPARPSHIEDIARQPERVGRNGERCEQPPGDFGKWSVRGVRVRRLEPRLLQTLLAAGVWTSIWLSTCLCSIE